MRSGIALMHPAGFHITGSTVEIHFAGIVNRNPGGTSATLMVKVWAHAQPYTGGAPGGHEIASFKIPPLKANARIAAVRNDVPYREPPFGSYHTTLTLEEFDSSARNQWVVVDALTFSGPDRIGRPLTLQGFTCSATNGAVNVEVARVLNDRQADASNALRLKCWATRASSSNEAGARHLLGEAPLGPLAPGRSHDGIRLTFTHKEVPAAHYHIAVVLEELDDDQWQPRDHALTRAALHLEEQPDKPETRFGVDLVQEAQAGRLTRPSFRDAETDALKRVLAKAGRNAACLIGEPGVGKTAVVEGLACAIAAGEVPESLKGARILDVNLSFLGAGASMRGEFEARVKELVELARTDRKTILFLDELHTVRASSNDASQMLKSDLGRGRISCIGATTTSEWRLLEADPALARRFQVVQVNELAPAQATEILRRLKAQFEQHHNVIVPDELLAQLVDFTVRYLRDGRLPDKAIDILDEACAHAAITSDHTLHVRVTVDDVCDVLALRTGLPPDSIRAGGLDLTDSDTLLSKLESAILGQDAVLRDTVRALARRARLGARPGDARPLWSALFAGPSGVGKTQLAKELAQSVFGDPDQHLIYINLADFRDEYTVSRLVGAPPGYVGYGEGGELTNALRRIATGVLLLDEIEKAHPKVLTQVLIGLLGEGIVKDMNDGRVFDVTEFIVILTSNLGSGSADTIGIRPGEDQAQRIRRVIADNLPREILGRIDDLLVFSSLPDAVLHQIWDREVDALTQQLAAGHPAIQLQIAPDVSAYLLEQVRAQAAAEGARAVKKLFEKQIAASCIDALDRAAGAGRLVLERAGAALNCRFEPEGQAQPSAQSITLVNLR